MVYLQLIISFIKIGLFSFGGGYAMIPLIQNEIESHNWLTPQQFIDIIAVAETTPGPIAVNSATFVGFKVAGFWGAVVSTIGVALPSFIIVLLIARAVSKFIEDPLMKGMLYGIRPVVISLILLAAVFVAKTVIFSAGSFLGLDWISIAIAGLALVGIFKLNMHPILLIVLAAVSGVLLY
ncbi:MAG: chromate transporter [Desulfitibacter sp. BRH_c19]|nr:MAG: chromate transporter [Desulfitibacter sp. BRH_c19]